MVSCGGPGVRYLAQAAYGQFDIMSRRQPMDEVIADPDTPPRTREWLIEVKRVLAFAGEHGLDPHGNYRHFVQLDRSAAVYFTAASKPLAFEPKVFCFPIVGCFPYLGWFDLDEALLFRRDLQRRGWDVFMRGASAYSTGGWFKDPLMSSMLAHDDDPNGLATLVNTILHELVHSNILINDQGNFNESVASFIGDGLAAAYLERYYGAKSERLALYELSLEQGEVRVKRFAATYEELNKVYESAVSDAVKRKKKKQIIDRLVEELRLFRRPNNAWLVGFKTYNTGLDDFAALLKACGNDWKRYITVLRKLGKSSFPKPLAEDFKPVLAPIMKAGCRAN